MSHTKAAQKPAEQKVFHPEYAGLRGLAVALVVVYHIWFNKVSGGVDVFLMLSAFFLTLSMWRRIESDKKFSLTGYWRKVSAKIVPATALVVTAVIGIAATMLPGNRFESILAQAKATILFGQNFQLAGTKVDYYNTTSAIASPLQHFWSLSIQGQFYLWWPLLILALAAIGLRTRKKLLGGLAVFGAASFAYALYTISQDPEAAYFSTPGRAWEFAFGGILALLIPIISRHIQRFGHLRAILGWIGAITLLSAGMVLHGQHFPGWASMVPLLSAAAIMIAGNTGTIYGFDHLLRSKPLQFVATHSYALFLWHWPVLIVVQRENTEMTFFRGLAIVLVSMVLAILTTRYVIDPLTKHGATSIIKIKTPVFDRPLRSPIPRTAAAAVAVTLIAALASTFNLQATQERVAAQPPEDNPGAAALNEDFVFTGNPAALTRPLTSQMHEQWAPSGERCPSVYGATHPQLINCFVYGEMNRSNAEKTIIAVGDSHVEQWMSALAPVAEERNWQLIRLHRPGCRFTLPGSRTDLADSVDDRTGCDSFRQAASDYILERKPDVVYTLATLSHKPNAETGEYAPESVVPGWEDAIQPFLDEGIYVVGQRDTPRATRNIAECVDVRGLDDPRCSIDPKQALAETNPLEELDAHPMIGTFEMTDQLCPTVDGEQTCPPVIGNVVVYLDQHHLTRDYVATTTTEFEKRFDSALE